jgi:hypothetical protein
MSCYKNSLALFIMFFQVNCLTLMSECVFNDLDASLMISVEFVIFIEVILTYL